jgi:hypothetical protein
MSGVLIGEMMDEAFAFPEDGEADPRTIAGRLVKELPRFEPLRHGDATILFVMRRDQKLKAQKIILGTMSLPKFQGTLGPFAEWLLIKACGGELPDFIMVLDATFWQQASMIQREALVYHELCHAAHKVDKDGEPVFDDEGNPVWDIVGHDIEEFNEVVERYGAWLPDIAGFIAAARRGGAA